jgi:DNA-binding CsgD family transcriptional regulator
MNDRSCPQQPTLAAIAAKLDRGLIVLDADGQVVWLDDATRRMVNGGLPSLKDAIATQGTTQVRCVLSTAEIVLNGAPLSVCVLKEAPNHPAMDATEIAAAIETVMADSSWFTRTIVEKFRALRQVSRPPTGARDLDMLTDRERDILALICEGRSDLDMSRTLGLSQNTVRNHVASLYRKIGVNRRSAAVIWARERAITSQDVLAPRQNRSRKTARENDHAR